MKNIFILLLLSFLLIGVFASCDHHDPERKIINDRLHIITHQGEVALLKKGSQIKENGEVEIWDDDKVIIQKNFVAYSLYEDFVVLCEEKDDDTQIFWTYEIQSEKLQEYSTYSELNKALPCNKLEWNPLWVKDFSIKS